MADKKPSKPKRRIRKAETVRQKAETAAKTQPKPRRLKRVASKASKPFKSAANVGKKEYYMPMPDNKAGRFLNKRRSIFPSYFKESYKELKLVTWPNRKQTIQLTIAVFIFAIAFGVMIAIVDYGLDKIFKRILLK